MSPSLLLEDNTDNFRDTSCVGTRLKLKRPKAQKAISPDYGLPMNEETRSKCLPTIPGHVSKPSDANDYDEGVETNVKRIRYDQSNQVYNQMAYQIPQLDLSCLYQQMPMSSMGQPPGFPVQATPFQKDAMIEPNLSHQPSNPFDQLSYNQAQFLLNNNQNLMDPYSMGNPQPVMDNQTYALLYAAALQANQMYGYGNNSAIPSPSFQSYVNFSNHQPCGSNSWPVLNTASPFPYYVSYQAPSMSFDRVKVVVLPSMFRNFRTTSRKNQLRGQGFEYTFSHVL